ncbi:Fur family transcriptional regulator [Mameliella sediminis]|uniref:Fur family transcriptional regulator n=1 Tax=Mameliella sediminis TaxID=2836866 RepID=UPI001C490620|nr:Fur family transcriptional regulator [Mameliella sediminis]MBY6116525.1 transcriptional repressor [Antarctobacter heliothermus]MBY6146278.1 transcriptional repressor [Mameliella alba]MBV7396617.1 transcriptional repressor [Mameliella sediminis]MBY6162907.1 transcriptional repressor [Mameliella alba]MBY6171171.1 transcriptional repressor [Mameliella alba]
MEAKGFEHHDHHHCIATALSTVEETCSAQGLQFTPVRRRVLEILLAEHRAMGAYEVLDVLREEGKGSQPPVAYRALDFLVANGFAHRIERLNAFIACGSPGEQHAPCFLICRGCSSVAETPGRRASQVLRESASELGFKVERVAIEAEGLCPSCAEADQ